MSLTLEIPAEVEAKLREVAAQEGRELNAFIVEAALQVAQARQKERAALAGLEEMTRINEELGLYDWELDAT